MTAPRDRPRERPAAPRRPSRARPAAALLVPALALVAPVSLLVLVLAAPPSSAQDGPPAATGASAAPDAPEAESPVALRVHSLRKGGVLARLGRWTWIPVEVENRGAAPLEGTLRVSRGTGPRPEDRSPVAYERAVSLGPRAKRVERLPYFCRERRAKVVVGWFARGATADPLAHEVIEAAEPDAWTALAVSRDDAAASMLRGAALGGMRRVDVETTALSLEELPERPEVYGAVDGIVIAGVDLRALSPAQGEAIEGFVESGGQLLLCFGGNPAEWRDTALEALLPVDLPERVEMRPLAPLSSFAGAERLAESAPAAIARPLGGAEVVLRDGDAPLIVRRRVGAGVVTFLAVDPTRRPFRGSAAARGVAERVFGAPVDPPPEDAFGRLLSDPLEASLAALSLGSIATRAPPFVLFGALLAAYVALAVPLNYRFWRARGRTERAAPTGVALALAFSAAVYGLGTATRSRAGDSTEVVLADGSEGDARGRVAAWCGITAPERRLARVEAEMALAPAPPRENVTSDAPEAEDAGAALVRLDPGGSRGRRRDLLDPLFLNQHEARRIAVLGPGEVPVVRADLAIGRSRVLGALEAPPGLPLRGAVVVLGRRFARLGDVAAGATRRLSAVLEDLSSSGVEVPLGERAESAPLALGRAELASLAARRPRLAPDETTIDGLLLAATDPEPTPLLGIDFAPPRSRAARLLAIGVRVGVEPGTVEVPAGVVRPRVTAEVGSQVTIEPPGVLDVVVPERWRGERIYRFDRGRLELELPVPARARLAPRRIELNLRGVRDAPGIEVTVIAPGAQQKLALDQGFQLTFTEPARYVDPVAGVVRLHVRVPDDGSSPLLFCEPEATIRGHVER